MQEFFHRFQQKFHRKFFRRFLQEFLYGFSQIFSFRIRLYKFLMRFIQRLFLVFLQIFCWKTIMNYSRESLRHFFQKSSINYPMISPKLVPGITINLLRICPDLSSGIFSCILFCIPRFFKCISSRNLHRYLLEFFQGLQKKGILYKFKNISSIFCAFSKRTAEKFWRNPRRYFFMNLYRNFCRIF